MLVCDAVQFTMSISTIIIPLDPLQKINFQDMVTVRSWDCNPYLGCTSFSVTLDLLGNLFFKVCD